MPFLHDDHPSLEQGIFMPHTIILPGLDSRESLFSILRVILASSVENYSMLLLENGISRISDDECTRDLSLVARAEHRQSLSFSSAASNALPKNDYRHLIYLFVLAMNCAANWAQQLKDEPVRRILDFLLPEYQDMLYRLSNLSILIHESDVTEFLFGIVEIMPGRPMIACHRHPYDDIHSLNPYPSNAASLSCLTMLSVLESISSQLTACNAHPLQHLERAFLNEMAFLIQQHRILFLSLLPKLHPIELIFLFQQLEYYLYDSLQQDEPNSEIKQLFIQERAHEATHIQKISALIHDERRLSEYWLPSLPSFRIQSQKGYVRETLLNLGVTLRHGKPVPVGALKKGADFFRYQRRLFPDPSEAPSHIIVHQTIEKNGTDFRYVIAPHPIERLRSRDQDALDIGR